MAKIYIKSI